MIERKQKVLAAIDAGSNTPLAIRTHSKLYSVHVREALDELLMDDAIHASLIRKQSGSHIIEYSRGKAPQGRVPVVTRRQYEKSKEPDGEIDATPCVRVLSLSEMRGQPTPPMYGFLGI